MDSGEMVSRKALNLESVGSIPPCPTSSGVAQMEEALVLETKC